MITFVIKNKNPYSAILNQVLAFKLISLNFIRSKYKTF